MSVSYRGSKLIPAPFITISKVPQKAPNGDIIGKTYNINVAGKIIANKGSPTGSGTFHTTSGYPVDEIVENDERLGAILRKQQAILDLFAVEGGSFEVQSLDGTEPMKCNPRVLDIQFPQGLWYTQCDYSISLEADRIYPIDDDDDLSLISNFSETWSVDTDESPENLESPRIYRLTHNVSAVGKKFFNELGNVPNEAWEHARDYVISRLGFDSSVALSSGVINLPAYYSGFNHVRSDNRDEGGGAYSVSESWILASGTTIEDFSVDTSKDISNGLIRVSINGSINGLEQRNSDMSLNTHKYTNALSRFNNASGLALARAQTYSGYTLNIQPVAERVGKNPVTGTINYSYEYDNRPSTIVSGALSEVISISDNLDSSVIAIIGVLGRAAGPVLQDLGMKRELIRQLSIEVVMPRPNIASNSLSDLQSAFFGQRPSIFVSGIIDAANPINQGYSQSYMTDNNEYWSITDGRYSRNISWTYQ